MDLRHLLASAVEKDRDKTDGHVENLAWNFVSVNLMMSVEDRKLLGGIDVRTNAILDELESDPVDLGFGSFLSNSSCLQQLEKDVHCWYRSAEPGPSLCLHSAVFWTPVH